MGSARLQDPFRLALAFTLRWEGWRSDDANDPGGMTIWGICSRDHPAEVAEMEPLGPEQAKAVAARVYRSEYWDRCKCGELPMPLAAYVFDCAVNCGCTRARRWLAQYPNGADYLDRRVAYYTGLAATKPQFQVFLRGWLRRVADLRTTFPPE